MSQQLFVSQEADPRRKFDYYGDDWYSGKSGSMVSDIMSNCQRARGADAAFLVQYGTPEVQLHKATKRVMDMGVLPYHLDNLPIRGKCFVCWWCHLGGTFDRTKADVKTGYNGIMSFNYNVPFLHPLRNHRNRAAGKHKGHKTFILADMTGSQNLPIKAKIETMLRKAVQVVDNPESEVVGEDDDADSSHKEAKAKATLTTQCVGGKAKAASPDEEEEAALQAENKALERQLHIQQLKEKNDALRAQLKGTAAEIGQSAVSSS